MFYDTCNSAIHPKGDDAAAGPACEDDPTFSDQCVDQYDLQAGKGQCNSLLTTGGYDCETMPAGYCDNMCDKCEGICPSFGPGQPNFCACDTYGGISNCPASCNGYCSADARHEVTPIAAQAGNSAATVPGRIDADCEGQPSGRHQWFKFTGYLGNTYQIYTEMVPGGLYSTYLHLHAKDDEQSELASAKMWHCNDPSVTPSGPGASCMIWACTATGEYSLRVQQLMGSGAFNVGIKDHGPIQAIAEQEGLAPQIAEVPDKGVYLENWSDLIRF